MTPKQVEIVQSTWALVVPIKDEAAAMFYGKLFEMDPSLSALFKGDMKEQGRKLMAMITTAVNSLTRLEALVPAVQQLGNRHQSYGVVDAHYATVGGALLWTLEAGLGSAFTPEVKEAWATTYGVLADTMKAAAASQAA